MSACKKMTLTLRSGFSVDIDPVIYDNDETNSVRAAYTYNKKFGFAAIFAHLSCG